MAVLPDIDRQRLWRGAMRWWSSSWESLSGMNKQDIRDAVNATDQWIDDNAGSYNSSLPLAFRTNATAAQKTFLFCVVAAMRVGDAFAKALVGEVD